jgi:putative transposase
MQTHANPPQMYRWRTMTPDQREQALACRRLQYRPWHSPPHFKAETSYYLLTAACYEHQPVIGHSDNRMAEFETALLDELKNTCQSTYAWIVLPNHYHALVQTLEVSKALSGLGQLHGRTSYQWNGEELTRGRKVWCGAVETAMKSERHFWASLLYVLNNAVRHRYVDRWQMWPFCNANEWLEEVGRESAERMWREFPIETFGDGWDPPDL